MPNSSAARLLEGQLTRSTKIYWVQAEGFGALSLAFHLTGENMLLDIMDHLWDFCRTYLYDPQSWRVVFLSHGRGTNSR